MEKLSGWFTKDITPVRIGAYEVRREPNGHQIAKWFSWWDGKRWSITAQTPIGAWLYRGMWSVEAEKDDGFEWRGILKGEQA